MKWPSKFNLRCDDVKNGRCQAKLKYTFWKWDSSPPWPPQAALSPSIIMLSALTDSPNQQLAAMEMEISSYSIVQAEDDLTSDFRGFCVNISLGSTAFSAGLAACACMSSVAVEDDVDVVFVIGAGAEGSAADCCNIS